MKAAVVSLFASLALLALAPAAAATEETFTLEPFGTLTLYHQTPRPSHVVLFVSGDGGWKLGVVDLARELEAMDAAVQVQFRPHREPRRPALAPRANEKR